MDPITYSLCQKPVVGLVMFMTSLCAFPPLFHDVPISLQAAHARVVKEFDAPVEKPYVLLITFKFASKAAFAADDVVGTRYDSNCALDYADIPMARKSGLGRPIPIHVTVSEKKTGKVVIDKVFNSLCQSAHQSWELKKDRQIGRLDLAKGSYIAEITNPTSQSGLDEVVATVSLVAGFGK